MGTPLNLRGLEQFRASALLERTASGGVPLEVDLDAIDFDPLQPRGTMNAEKLAELAASIKTHGVLEPVSLRRHPEVTGRYVVNRGERRVRASRAAGRPSVPAWIDDRVDRYAQAAENLHRDDLSPFDLARFIADREREGDSRVVIASRLGKPASFITEVAALIDAPAEVRAVYESGRSRDTRVLYRLTRALRSESAVVSPVQVGDGPITRASVAVLGRAPVAVPPEPGEAAGGRKVQPLHKAEALLIEHAGAYGRLSLSGWPGRRTGEVRFEDGTRKVLELSELKLINWTGR